MSRTERKKQDAEAKKASAGTKKVNIKEKFAKFKNWFKSQARWKQVLMIAGTTIVTLAIILAIVVFSIFNSIFADVFEPTAEDYDLSLQAVDGYYNILLMGVDSRDMEELDGTRSDALMVLSINEETSEVKILSIYRDTYLKMGDTYTYDKITHACVYGGPEMTTKSLNQALDLNISNYVVVNFKAVADLVDAVGGIEVNIEDYEINELNRFTKSTATHLGYDDYKIVEQAGLQTLDGCQAVSYSRIRKGVGDDFKRTERMRTVVSLTAEKMKGLPFKDLRKIIKVVTPHVQTNISMKNVLGLAFRLPQYNITGTEGWPYNVTTGLINGVSYVLPSDLAYNTAMMHADFFGQEDYVPSDKVYEISNQIAVDIQAAKDVKEDKKDKDKEDKKDKDSNKKDETTKNEVENNESTDKEESKVEPEEPKVEDEEQAGDVSSPGDTPPEGSTDAGSTEEGNGETDETAE